MPSSHLPRTPCNKFIYDFLCDFFWASKVATGYGVCVHIVNEHRAISTGPRGQPGGKSVQRPVLRLYGNHAMSAWSVQLPCSLRSPPHGNRTGARAGDRPSHGAHAGDCAMPSTTCLRATVLQFFQICTTSR